MHQPKGFTLIEMLITLALLAIIASFGIPQLNQFIVNQRIQAQATALQSTLQFARTEASSKNRVIKVLPRTNNSSGWSSGWCVVTSDINNCNGTVIKQYPAVTGEVSITGNYLQTGTFISFRRDGTRSPAVSGGLKVSSSRIPADSKRARCIALDAIGRVKISNIAPSDGC